MIVAMAALASVVALDASAGETVAEDADCFTARFASPDTRLFGIER